MLAFHISPFLDSHLVDRVPFPWKPSFWLGGFPSLERPRAICSKSGGPRLLSITNRGVSMAFQAATL